VQRVTGVSNRRIKGDIWETAPSLPPLKLSREGSFSSFTAHRCRCPLPKILHIQSTLAIHLPLKSVPGRQGYGTAQDHQGSEVFWRCRR
jgi:hypothetical protein